MIHDDLSNKWDKFMQLIRANVGQQRFDTWFAEASPSAFDGQSLEISIPSHFFFEKYEDDFYNIIAAAKRRVFGDRVKITYLYNVINHDAGSRVRLESTDQSHIITDKVSRQVRRPVNPLEEGAVEVEGEIDAQLNESLTFENYCVGESNLTPLPSS